MQDHQQFVSEDELAALYGWLDEIPLSRPKRNIARDFADGVMTAEVIAHFVPRLIETHNYQPCAGKKQKKMNWQTLNKKVLKRLGKMSIPDNVIDAIVAMRPGVIEVVLIHLRINIEAYLAKHSGKDDRRGDDDDDIDDDDDAPPAAKAAAPRRAAPHAGGESPERAAAGPGRAGGGRRRDGGGDGRQNTKLPPI